MISCTSLTFRRHWKTSQQIYKHSALKEIPSKCFFVQEEGFPVQTAQSLFTVKLMLFANFQLLCTCKNWTNHKVRKKNMKTANIKEMLTYTVHYIWAIMLNIRMSFCGTNSQTDYTNGIDYAWAGCKAGYSLQR